MSTTLHNPGSTRQSPAHDNASPSNSRHPPTSHRHVDPASVISLPFIPHLEVDDTAQSQSRQRPSWLVGRIVGVRKTPSVDSSSITTEQQRRTSCTISSSPVSSSSSPNRKIPRRIRRSLRKKKLVRFADEIEIFPVFYLQADVHSLWYSASERRALLEQEKNLAEELTWTDSLAAADPTSWIAIHRRVFEAVCSGKQKADVILAELGLLDNPNNNVWAAPGSFVVDALGMGKKPFPSWRLTRLTAVKTSVTPSCRPRKLGFETKTRVRTGFERPAYRTVGFRKCTRGVPPNWQPSPTRLVTRTDR